MSLRDQNLDAVSSPGGEPSNQRRDWIDSAAGYATAAAGKLDCAVQLSGDTLGHEINVLEGELDEIAKKLLALTTSTHWLVCCNCGQITPEEWWTYWHASDEWMNWEGDMADAPAKYRPSRPGEGDPMMLCPSCKWEHVDDDSNPGILDMNRTYIEALAARRGEEPMFAEDWQRVLEELKGANAPEA